MKRRIKRIMATVIAVLVMVPMFTFSGYAAFGEGDLITPYAYGDNNYFFFLDETMVDGYKYVIWEESFGYPASSSPFVRTFMEFNPEEDLGVTKTVNYVLNNRIDYGFLGQDFLSDSFRIQLEPDMYIYFGGDEDQYVDISYDLTNLQYCYFIFGTANLDYGTVLGAKGYYEDDFHVYG